jgi:hypothetical protein
MMRYMVPQQEWLVALDFLMINGRKWMILMKNHQRLHGTSSTARGRVLEGLESLNR